MYLGVKRAKSGVSLLGWVVVTTYFSHNLGQLNGVDTVIMVDTVILWNSVSFNSMRRLPWVKGAHHDQIIPTGTVIISSINLLVPKLGLKQSKTIIAKPGGDVEVTLTPKV